MSESPDDGCYENASTFDRLRNCVDGLLKKFGSPDSLLREGDYCVHADYTGQPQVVVFVHDLRLLRPRVVSALQDLVKDFPGWQVEVTVAVRGHYEDWPNMGLYVREHEIIDGLLRRY